MKLAKEEKFQFVSVRAVSNGWEIYTGDMSQMRAMDNTYVFETWDSMHLWLKERLQNNEQ